MLEARNSPETARFCADACARGKHTKRKTVFNGPKRQDEGYVARACDAYSSDNE